MRVKGLKTVDRRCKLRWWFYDCSHHFSFPLLFFIVKKGVISTHLYLFIFPPILLCFVRKCLCVCGVLFSLRATLEKRSGIMRRQHVGLVVPMAERARNPLRTVVAHGGFSSGSEKPSGGARELFNRELATPKSRPSFAPYFSVKSSQYGSLSTTKAKLGRAATNESAAQIFAQNAEFLQKSSQTRARRGVAQPIDSNLRSRAGSGAPAVNPHTNAADSAYMRAIRSYYGYLNAFRSAKYAEVNRLEEKVSRLNVAAAQERERFGRDYLVTFFPLLLVLFAFMEEQALRTCAQHALAVLEDHRDSNSSLPHVKI